MFKNLRIGTRVLASFIAVSACMGIAAAVAVTGMARINAGTKSIYEDRVHPLQQLKVVADGYAVSIVDNTHKVRAHTVDFVAGAATIKAARTTIDSAWKAYTATTLTPEEAKLVAATELQFKPANVATDTLLAILARRDTVALARFASTGLYPAIDPVSESVSKLIELQVRVAGEEFASSTGTYHFIRGLAIVASLFVAFFAIAVGLWISRYLSRGVSEILARLELLRREAISTVRRASEAMAAGDLSVTVEVKQDPIPVTSRDELGQLAEGLNRVLDETTAMAEAAERSRETLSWVIEAAGEVVDAARSGDLSHRADASRYAGAYGTLVAGLNDTVEAVAKPLQAAAGTLQCMADKDLTARMPGEYPGEYQRLQSALNDAVATLGTTLTDVGEASEQVANASQQVAAGSQSLAAGATTQASALEQVASSLHELDSQTLTNAQHARTAHEMADTARRTTADGLTQMHEMSTAIGEIREASTATARILKTIEEIAFQTNLLALNAAVEAARAGDAGRGFAVVAEEVRALALRSAEASRQTAELVERSTQSSRRGVALNDAVLERLGAIDADVSKVAAVMEEILAASQQQTEGVKQINAAIEQVNAVVQMAASNSEESAAASEELSSQAATTLSMVRQFRLSDDGTDARGRAFAAPPSALRGGRHSAQTRVLR